MLFLVEIIYFYMYMLLLNLAPQYFSRESIKFLSVNCINMKVSGENWSFQILLTS